MKIFFNRIKLAYSKYTTYLVYKLKYERLRESERHKIMGLNIFSHPDSGTGAV